MSKRKSVDVANNGGPTESKKIKTNGHWSMGLLETVNDPKYFVKDDELVNVIKDKYPKAKFHYLIMPKEKITSLKSVTSEHASLLRHMEEVALDIVTSEEHKNSTFKLGYHAEASMTQLHLHVISDDMMSDCVKTKKHWNSFTTEFFISSEDIRENLDKNGKVLLPSRDVCKKCMETPLKCHKCDVKPKNMPELKRHLLTHLKE